MNDTKNCVRMADRIREALRQLRYGRYSELNRQMTTLTDRLQQLTAESRKMRASIARGWLSAAHRCCDNLSRLLGEIEYSVPRVRPWVEKPQEDIPTLLVLVDELDALQQEFGGIEFDASKNTLSVATEPITLDDIYLGPFRIQLELNKLEQLYHCSPYSVIALEPNPAATNDSVTHPHVSDEKLCEGEGCAAIRAALEDGRICDFFTIVRSILNTYSADSPYVSLDDWDGRACYDCGRSVASEDIYYCERCDHDYCSDCSTYCRRCEETVCLSCSGQCAYCEEMLCRNCVSKCKECGELFCEACLKDDLCPNCTEEQENEDEQEESTINESEVNTQPQAGPTEVRLAS